MKLVLAILLIVCSAIVLALLIFAILGVYISNEMFDFLYRNGEDKDDN